MRRSASGSPVHWSCRVVAALLATACTVPRRGLELRRNLATAYTRRMSWLGRLFGSKPPAAPPNSVVVASDLVQPLTANGVELSTAVDSALRAYLDAQAK